MIGSGLAQATPSPMPASAPVQPGKARRPGAGLSSPPQAKTGAGGVSSAMGMLGTSQGGSNMSVGGVVAAQSLASILKEQAKSALAADEEQQQPEIVGLASHVKKFWEQARQAKRPFELSMLEALYARRGAYTAEKLQEIRDAGQPPIYMMLGASKMRQAEALLRDVLIGSGTEKPWTLQPEPVSELPPMIVAQVKAAVSGELQEALMAGAQPSMDDVRQRLNDIKDELTNKLRDEAMAGCERMEDKMETQLDEGGFNDALDAWITDLCTFKTAFLAGPIVRIKPKLSWLPNNPVPMVQTTQVLEWERVDPFDMYPAPWARTINEGPLIRRHKLTREALNEMIGVDGFSDDSIKQVLALYGEGGLNDWLTIDSEVAHAEGKTTIAATMQTGLIDALQFWGSVSGQMLRDWGMKPKDVPDVSKEYQVEAWLIGNYIIKATLNNDPLARRPFYSTSYERVPGSVWGNAPYDLMADCQAMCNGAARSLAANLGIASGPQVVVNVSRLPTGEQVTNMYPWKIWQVEEDPMGNVAPPITFFQPSSNAAELMGVYEKFSALADEYTGIPRYMTGNEGTPGAGRTASGLSMMIGNASKIIKQVVGSTDIHVLEPLIERLYYYNMRYATDPDLKRAITVKARGAMSLTTKDAAQVRRNEFLTATNNPVDMQIIGLDGRAEVLRSAAKTLDMNPDKIVPPVSVLKARQAAQQAAQIAGPTPGSPGSPGTPGGAPPQGPGPSGPPGGGSPNGQQLSNGAPVTDNFQPPQGA